MDRKEGGFFTGLIIGIIVGYILGVFFRPRRERGGGIVGFIGRLLEEGREFVKQAIEEGREAARKREEDIKMRFGEPS